MLTGGANSFIFDDWVHGLVCVQGVPGYTNE